jgi:hypothetical protein
VRNLLVDGCAALYSGFVDETYLPHGFGEYRWTLKDNRKGDVYVGEFRQGLFHGVGMYINKKSGWRHIGIYTNGKGSGVGRCEYQQGSCFSGQFNDGKMCGYGKYSSKTGIQYIGEFKNDQRHGTGLQIRAHCTKAVVVYDNGRVTSEFKGLCKFQCS